MSHVFDTVENWYEITNPYTKACVPVIFIARLPS